MPKISLAGDHKIEEYTVEHGKWSGPNPDEVAALQAYTDRALHLGPAFPSIDNYAAEECAKEFGGEVTEREIVRDSVPDRVY